MLHNFLKKSGSAENLAEHAKSPKKGHVRSPSNDSIADLEAWTKQRQSEKVSLTWKVRFGYGSLLCVPVQHMVPSLTSPFLIHVQDLTVIVKPTGKVLLNKVTGNISNGYYAIMVRLGDEKSKRVSNFSFWLVHCRQQQPFQALIPASLRFFSSAKGPSGSGKTTLLNTLACRLDRNTKVGSPLIREAQSGRPKHLQAPCGTRRNRAACARLRTRSSASACA